MPPPPAQSDKLKIRHNIRSVKRSTSFMRFLLGIANCNDQPTRNNDNGVWFDSIEKSNGKAIHGLEHATDG